MKNFAAITLALFLCALHSFASDPSGLWQKGNALYDQKQYDSAAWYFEQIAATHPQNAEVYYNLGNTYYRLNKIPQAVLNYERALHIDPEYKLAKDNLQLAQARVSNHILTANDIFFIKWWNAITSPRKATLWSMIALCTFILIVLVMAVRHFQKQRRLPAQLPVILGFACICFLLFAACAARNGEQHAEAVIMQSDAPLMSADLRGKPLTLVPEGTCVKILDKKDNWLEVKLPDGRTGWLQQNLVERV